ncbi:hypothetical protein MIND_01318900 [Mycena indigotica]|uniref:NAD(P)-binding protein n=1 Tax=Mycena indigotica TaxID=2126181 RepID=A0A8H6RZX1_9AGAR|nr:uncharacterized protein MIND_01318900 [Mycena indigotica]KAF7290780.1 hypothetical protein MIND_01318900 [Mycena indigotica]
MALRPLFVVAGIGNASGTGSAAARAFAKAGYSVALIARNQSSLDACAQEINSRGGEAAPFCMPSYSSENFSDTFRLIESHFPASKYAFRAALFNIGYAVWKPFLETTPQEVEDSLNTNVAAAFAFSRETILKFKNNPLDEQQPTRGTLIFTGATASTRGSTTTSAFSASKSGLRSLSQSLAKEFGKDDIHVAHTIIDGLIQTGTAPQNETLKLDPASIAEAHLYLTRQAKSAWTWELDLRPASEKW